MKKKKKKYLLISLIFLTIITSIIITCYKLKSDKKIKKYIDKKIYNIHVYIEIEKSPSKSVISPSK